jgi:hypothetical protein
MPPKAKAKTSTGGKATGGGRGSGRTGTRGDSARQKTTVFKTNSIGNSIGQATSRSITMEVENRAGEGYPAQTLLKMFFFPLQRAKLIAFLKQEEPVAMQSGWDWQENTKATAPNAHIMSLLTLMAANNNSSGLTPDLLPVLLQSLGLPVPASASTSTSSASSVSSSIASLTSASQTADLTSQIQAAVTAALTEREAGKSTSSRLSPAKAGTRSASTPTKISSSASSVSTIPSPSPSKKDAVKVIAEMLVAGTITFEQAAPACAAAGVEFARVMQSWQTRLSTQQRVQRSVSSIQPAGTGSGLRSSSSSRSSFRARSPAPAPVSLVDLDSGIADMDRCVGRIVRDLDRDETEERRSSYADARNIAGDFGVYSDASSAASSRHASPIPEFSTEDLDIGILRFFARKDKTIARSKVRKFFERNVTRLGELGVDIPDIPRHGSGYAKDVPEDTMRNAARTCVHCMFTTRPDLPGILRAALVDGTFHKGPQQVRFADSPVTPAGTPASTPHRQTHLSRPSLSSSSSSSASSSSVSRVRQNLTTRLHEDQNTPLPQRKRKDRDDVTGHPDPSEPVHIDISTDVTNEQPPKQRRVAEFFRPVSTVSASGSGSSAAGSGSASTSVSPLGSVPSTISAFQSATGLGSGSGAGTPVTAPAFTVARPLPSATKLPDATASSSSSKPTVSAVANVVLPSVTNSISLSAPPAPSSANAPDTGKAESSGADV